MDKPSIIQLVQDFAGPSTGSFWIHKDHHQLIDANWDNSTSKLYLHHATSTSSISYMYIYYKIK